MESSLPAKRRKLEKLVWPVDSGRGGGATLLSGRCPLRLLDACVQAVAYYYPCRSIEDIAPACDELLLQKIAAAAFPKDEKAIELYAKLARESSASLDWEIASEILKRSTHLIKEPLQVGFIYTSIVISLDSYDSLLAAASSLTAGVAVSAAAGAAAAGVAAAVAAAGKSSLRRARVSCTFEQRRIVSTSCSWCRHLWCQHVIAAVLFRIRQPDEVPVHAPMTEILTNLSREKLQKLVHYAVHADPASVLPKLFRTMDDIRDEASTVNRTHGAPDATMDPHRTCTDLTEQSVRKLKENIKTILRKSITSYRYNFVDNSMAVKYCGGGLIEKSELQEYIEQIVQVFRNGDAELGVGILLLMTEALFQYCDELSTKTNLVTHLCHYVDRLMCIAALDVSPKVQMDVLIAAKKFKEKGRSPALKYLKMPRTPWLELPAVRVPVSPTTASSVRHLLEDNRQLFDNTIYVCRLNWEHPALTDVLNGTVSFRDATTYKEDITIGLLRLERLFLLMDGRAKNLAYVLLYRLLLMSDAFSIVPLVKPAPTSEAHRSDASAKSPLLVGALSASSQSERPSHISSKVEGERAAKVKAATRIRRASKRKARDSSAEAAYSQSSSPAAYFSLATVTSSQSVSSSCPSAASSLQSSADFGELDISFIVPSILYIVEEFHKNSDWLRGSSTDGQVLVAKGVLRVLELMKLVPVQDFRACEYYKEKRLSLLESEAFTRAPAALAVVDEYVQHLIMELDGGVSGKCRGGACRGGGVSGEALPLQLMCHFLKFYRHERRWLLLGMCALFVIRTVAVASWDKDESGAYVMLINFVLENAIVDDERDRSVVSRMIISLQEMSCTHMLTSVILALRKHCDILERLGLLEHVLHLTITKLRQHEDSDSLKFSWYDRLQITQLLKKIVSLLGQKGLEFLLNNQWAHFMSANTVIDLLHQLVKESSGEMESKELQLLLEALRAKWYTCDKAENFLSDAVVWPLLETLQLGSSSMKKVYSAICVNAKNIHPGVVLRVAKLHYERSSTCKKSEQPKDNAFKLIEAAFISIGSHPGQYEKFDKNLDYIEWTNSVCFAGKVGDVVKSSMFHKYICSVATHCTSLPFVILKVLEQMEKTFSFFKHRSPLCEVLIPACKEYFVRYYKNSSTATAVYNDSIEKMLHLRARCQAYVKIGGQEKFDSQVLAHIKEVYKTRKKLICMLNAQLAAK